MLFLDAEKIRALAPMPDLIESLRKAFRTEYVVPPRQVTALSPETARLFVSMPAFDHEGAGMVKLATLFPENQDRGLPNIQAAIVVFSTTGTPVALLDGTVVTHLRTGAASALASSYLSRPDSSALGIVGTGALAPTMAQAHCAARPIRRISVWGRRSDRASTTVAAIRSRVNAEVDVRACDSLEQVVKSADIVSCATSSASPLVHGKWLKPGAFVDLVGSFSPSTREADDDVVRRSRIFVDTFEGALSEAGDLLDPLARGIIDRSRIEGQLADLVRGLKGRTHDDEIILFKSVGTAIEDLAAAQMIVAASSARRR